MACSICGAEIPAGDLVCPNCEQYAPDELHKEILQAMRLGFGAELDGIKYNYISAYIVRARASHLNALKFPFIIQVELMGDACRVIADPRAVKILKPWERDKT